MFRGVFLVGSFVATLGAFTMAIGAPVPGEDAKSAVKTYFSQLEKGAGDSAPLLAPPAKDVIAELEKYLASGTDVQQSHAVRLIALIGRRSAEKEARTLAAKALLSYASGDRKVAGRQALDNLLQFSKDDFPPKSDAQIEKLVRAEQPLPEALLLAGIVEVRSVIDDLKALTKVKYEGNEEFAFGNPAWSAHLALGRLGEADSTKHCVQAIEAEKDIVQRVRHFGELAFIGNSETAKVITRYLSSDERLPQVKITVPGTKVAQYALDVMAESIEGFPIKSERGPSYTEAQLSEARKWVKEQKQLKFKR
jgi:hypothetical protein